MLTRRGMLSGLICAPAIVRASSLMPIKDLFKPLPFSVLPPGTYAAKIIKVHFDELELRVLSHMNANDSERTIVVDSLSSYFENLIGD